MFEAIHGSASDVAGKGRANPSGAILSLSLMLGHLGERDAARAVEAASVQVLGELAALAGPAMGMSTSEVGSRIAALVPSGEADLSPVPHSLLATLAALPASRR